MELRAEEEAVLGVSSSRLALAVPGQAVPVATINDVLLTILPGAGHKISGKKKKSWAESREGGDRVSWKSIKSQREKKKWKVHFHGILQKLKTMCEYETKYLGCLGLKFLKQQQSGLKQNEESKHFYKIRSGFPEETGACWELTLQKIGLLRPVLTHPHRLEFMVTAWKRWHFLLKE